MILQEHGKWILRSKDGTKVLGIHNTREEAVAQERAIEYAKHSDGMRVGRYERMDKANLKPPVRMDNGFLRVEGRLARVGVQEYRKADGSVSRELRLPDEVFDADSMASFSQLPVTNRHPPGMLTATNAKQYAVGSVGENVRRDGDYMIAPLMITDADAITAAEKGRCQLSNGYSCELDDTQDSGLEARWGKYDSIMRKIRGNHVALVDVARAGPEARIRLDEGEAISGFGVSENNMLTSYQIQETTPMAHKFKIDGFEVEVADSNTQAIIERAIESAKAEESKRANDVQGQLVEMKIKHDKLDAKVQAYEAKIAKCDECDGGGKCDNCGGVGTVKMDHLADDDKRAAMYKRMWAKMERGAVATRVALLNEGKPYLPTNVKLDEKTNQEIKAMIIKKLAPDFVTDGKSEDILDEVIKALRGTRTIMKEKPSKIDLVRTVQTDEAVTRDDDQPSTSPQEARQRMIERNRKALVK